MKDESEGRDSRAVASRSKRLLVIVSVGVILLAMASLGMHFFGGSDTRIDYGPYVQSAYHRVANELYPDGQPSVEEALAAALQEMRAGGFGYRQQLDALTIYYNDDIEVWTADQPPPDTIFLMSGSLTVIGERSGYSAQGVFGPIRLLPEKEAHRQRELLRAMPPP